MGQAILLNDLDRPRTRELDADIDYVCDSLGLASGRDTHRIGPEIVRVLLHDASNGMTSDDIAVALDIETQRALYHLRSLIRAGLLVRHKRHIMMRQGSMSGALTEVQRDANRIFERLLRIAHGIDAELGLVIPDAQWRYTHEHYTAR